MASCKFCGKSIIWAKDGRKNIPLEEDGVPHRCKEFEKTRSSGKVLDRGSLSPEEIARYEKAINDREK
ncbi:MAG: hypothetical protein OXB88_05365 [Bacteriovoracales bacterium]|nr:hypothetical protein [Bacteriovoracales bacterium]